MFFSFLDKSKNLLQGLQKFLVCMFLFFSACIPSSNAWEIQILASDTLPPNLVVVDKGAKSLFYIEKQSPLAVQLQFPSIHGQEEGDKEKEGDLRTPEGVYFITGKINMALDFNKYGSHAYGLNYPNPVDRLRDKTGHGIWIHSKGQPIENQSTEGCIAVDLGHMENLAPNLIHGTPVLVAQSVLNNESDSDFSVLENSEAEKLRDLTKDWNTSWAARSGVFFDFYEEESYTKTAGNSFSSFQSTKKNLFLRLPWIYIEYGDIYAMEGPGYWVTWFEQLYYAPNLKTEGIRRLYWQPNAEGEMKIVGMEWLPQELGIRKEYVAGQDASAKEFVEEWRLAWEMADVDAYASFYSQNAFQTGRKGQSVIVAHKEKLWADTSPTNITFTNIETQRVKNGISVSMLQNYTDSTGYSDKGIKHLLLYPEASSWRIVNESWIPQ